MFPGTLVFLVLRNPANPISCRSEATSGSESISISVLGFGSVGAGMVSGLVLDVALVGAGDSAGWEVDVPLGVEEGGGLGWV